MHTSLPVFGDSCLRCLGKLEKLTSPEPQAHADPMAPWAPHARVKWSRFSPCCTPGCWPRWTGTEAHCARITQKGIRMEYVTPSLCHTIVTS